MGLCAGHSELVTHYPSLNAKSTRGPLPELSWTPKLDMLPTFRFPLAYHFVAGPGSLTLELGELSPVMDGDEQLPDDQKRKPSQEDAADHGQEDGHGTGSGPTLWRSREQ